VKLLNNLKRQIIELAKSNGINKIGFANIDGKSVIVALFPYYVANERGNVAMYARARDYHKVNAEKLEILREFLRQNGANECKIFVDNAARNDRKAAFLAGLGFYGWNNMLICDEYGSYFTIGQIVTDLEMEPDKPLNVTCQSCGKCANACPSGICDGNFNKSLCISEITQKKGELTEREAELLKLAVAVWGCDICQQVCPHNENLATNASPELMQNRIASLALSDVYDLTDEKFRQKYEQYAFCWRGIDVLKRNLDIITKM
jgi:epoxyqueuosine reductase QueG